jgi:hypothetical protein
MSANETGLAKAPSTCRQTSQTKKETIMNTTIKSVAATIIFALAASAQAADSTTVNLSDTVQRQNGTNGAMQSLGAGNVSNGGQSNVLLTKTTQKQSGGTGNIQKLNAGNVSGGGKSKVVLSNTLQSQKDGSESMQSIDAGNISKDAP